MGKTELRIVCAIAVVWLSPALATEQVYHPISPTFGGNPNNGTFLLSTAQSQGAGVNSGNQGPTINFPDFGAGSGGGSGGSGSGGSGGGGSGAAGSSANGSFRQNNLANPLGTSSGRF
jgi:curli production assembly/transport component CsgF